MTLPLILSQPTTASGGGGGLVVSFTGYTPPPRYDGQPWTQAQIEESTSALGPWTVIDTVALVADTNPAAPAPRSFTTQAATLPDGWYRVTWIDATGDVSPPTEPTQNSAGGDAVPTIEEVAALLHARTTQRGGGEVGTFTATTRPTADQVDGLILQAAAVVMSSTGRLPSLDECPDAPTLTGAVRTLIAMRAALFIEPSLWPEQTTAGVGPYTALREQYEAELPRVADAVRDCIESGVIEPGEAGVGAGALPANAAWAFGLPAGYDWVQW